MNPMLVVTHVMTGAMLGLLLAPEHAFFVFFLSFIMHFLIDIIPHGDAKLYATYLQGKKLFHARLYVAVDVLCSALLLAFIWMRPLDPSIHTLVLWGVAGGVFPDILVGLYEQFRFAPLAVFHRFHLFFHDVLTKRVGDVPFWFGVSAQAVLITGFFLFF